MQRTSYILDWNNIQKYFDYKNLPIRWLKLPIVVINRVKVVVSIFQHLSPSSKDVTHVYSNNIIIIVSRNTLIIQNKCQIPTAQFITLIVTSKDDY